MAYQTKIHHLKLTLSPFTTEAMEQVGKVLVDSVTKRIKSGKNAQDETSKALKGAHGNYEPYALQKTRKALQGIRDWTYSGRLLRSMKVLSVNQAGGKIGFIDARSNNVAVYLDKIDKAFGISPTDEKAASAAVAKILLSSKIVETKVE